MNFFLKITFFQFIFQKNDIISRHGKLAPAHSSSGTPGEIILIPAKYLFSDIDCNARLLIDSYEPGHKDVDGNVHTGYFLCDDEGNKLNSRLKLTQNGLSIRSNPNWANDFFHYDVVYDEGLESFIYQANFYSAYTIRTGNVIHSNLQNTFLNLEHINPTEHPLPKLNTEYIKNKKAYARVTLRKSLKSEIDKKAIEFALVLNQLGGLFTFQQIETGKILVSDAFLNLHNEGYLYSLSLFESILKSLQPRAGDAIYGDGSIVDPTASNYWLKQITRGQPDSSGKFIKSPQTIDQFYKAWLDLIQNDLSRDAGSQRGSATFEKHRGKLENLQFAASEDVYKLIDNALEHVFGYTAFMSLLSGIMTFSKPTLVSEYEIDFWCHTNVLQIKLLNKFVGRHLSTRQIGDLGSFNKIPRHEYFASIFLFGVKRGNRHIAPSSDFFLDNYYKKHVLLSMTDYKKAEDLFLYRSFSEFLGEPRTVQKLNKMNIIGRQELFEFLAKKLYIALEAKLDLRHEDYVDLFFNELIERIFHPTSKDIVTQLRNIFFKRSSDTITLSIKYDSFPSLSEQVSLEISYEELIEIISPEQLFTMTFYYTKLDNYYLDFDLAWHNLAEKVGKAYTLLKDTLSKAPIAPKETLKVKFYQKSATGIKPITEKTYSLLSTKFSQSEFDIKIDPENQEDLETKVLSMIFWMIMEPNIIPVVKLPNGDNFLIMDIYELYDGDRFSSVLTGTFSPPSDYEQRQKQFYGIFTRSDLMSFVNFHNHEQSDEHSDMISYVMEKFKGLYVLLGGNTRSDLIDLR